MALRLLAVLFVRSTAFDFQIKNLGHGEYLGFYYQDVVLDRWGETNGLLWRVVPVDAAQHTYKIQNLYGGPSEHRYGQYVSWSHARAGVISSDEAQTGEWQLEPTGQTNVFKLKNVWHGPSDPRYGLYMGSTPWKNANYDAYMSLVSVEQAGLWQFITPGIKPATVSLTDLQALHEAEDTTAAANTTKAFNLAENLAPVDMSADRVAAPTEMLVADDGLAVPADRSGYFALAGAAAASIAAGVLNLLSRRSMPRESQLLG